MKNKDAFTLIELLVVIAIIALLMAIVMPSLRLAKDHARKIHCSANLKSLVLAARMYADENDGHVPSASNRWRDENNRWRAGWCGRTCDTSRVPFPIDEQIYGSPLVDVSGLVNGQLWPYIETPDAWRCPADPGKEQLRSYGMAAQWWNQYYLEKEDWVIYDPGTKGRIVKKISKIKSPGQRFMFVDQAGYNADGYAALWYSQPKWWNIPNFFHNGGSVNGYADGHVEPMKLAPETVEVARTEYEYYADVHNVDPKAEGGYKMPQGRDYHTEDLQYYQRATWGSLGY